MQPPNLIRPVARLLFAFAWIGVVFSARALPDLIVWGPAIVPAISIETFTTNDCEVLECVTPGTRRLLRFDTETRNIGTTDLALGNPATNALFHYDPCHGHYHLEEYCDYRLRNSNGVVMLGQKIGFCLLDWSRWDTTNGNPNSVYNCSNQGIQKGWGDTYVSSLPCQYIDITSVPAGTYTLEVEVNPDRVLTESNYSNNIVSVTVVIPTCHAITLSNSVPNDIPGGNGNGSVDPGEIIYESIGLRNSGCPATNVVASLSTTNAGVTVLQGVSAYPDIPDGGLATNSTAFRYRVAKSVPCGTLVQFSLVIVSGTGVQTNVIARSIGQDMVTTNSFTAADVPRNILDVATVFSTNVVSLAGTNYVAAVSLSLRLNHTYDEDLVIALRHPDATEVVLVQNRGDSGENFGTGSNTCTPTSFTFLSDNAATPIASGGVPPFAIPAGYRPENPLSTFTGKPVNGAWKLRITDTAGNDVGVLGCWKLSIVAAQNQFVCSNYNHVPIASNLAFNLPAGLNPILLAGSDDDAEPIQFATNSTPARGLVTGFNPLTGALNYTPAHGFTGADAFTFRVIDGTATSSTATVTLNMPPPADANTNGLPDAWESFYGLSNPAADDDGDGLTNLQEYFAGTNPVDSKSWLRVVEFTGSVGGGFAMMWPSVGGVRYRVSFSNGDAQGNYDGAFTPLVRSIAQEMDSAAPGVASTQTFTDDYSLTGGVPASGRRYYRVEVVQ